MADNKKKQQQQRTFVVLVYNKNTYFAGDRLDIGWLSYNFALILLKLIHFADLDDEFKKR